MAPPIDLTALKAALAALPTAGVDSDELQRLGKRVRKATATGSLQAHLRIRVVSSYMVEMLGDALAGAMARRGIVPDLSLAPYGALPTELLAGGSLSECDMVVILPSHRDLMHAPDAGCSRQTAAQAAETEASFWAGLWNGIELPIVQLSFDPPPYRVLSEADGFLPGGRLHHLRAVNQCLAALAPANVAVVDSEALAARVGSAWNDARTYALCKQPFANSAIAEVAETIAAAAVGLLGRSRKVLVLDLDNTIWGGVVGDVGSENLVLGMETAEGEAFIALQLYAKALAQRGVILAVCSKNEDAIARAAFDGHTAMVLRTQDIACFVANFDDKATNLSRIAAELNVGLDSLVFVDDNPVEREWVKNSLPEVLVIDLPRDPSGYVQAIESAKPFPLHLLTQEDLGRNRSYATRQAIGAGIAAAGGDIGAFLESLEPQATVAPLLGDNEDRIVQLIAKTNQFKLNPTVYTATELRQVGRDVFAISLADRMTTYGIVSVVVFETEGTRLRVLQWVMSCRVFSRRLEHLVLELLRREATQAGCERIALPFALGAKNAVALRALQTLGFSSGSGDELEIDAAGFQSIDPHYMTISYSKAVQ